MTSPGPVDRAALPPDVRGASSERQAVYAAALQFEQVLATQLAEAMLPSEEDGDGAKGVAQLLPSALADGLAAAGGLGVARHVFDATEDGNR